MAGPEQPVEPPAPWMPPSAGPTPNAEKYLLEADALRRRQLVSALLHGSTRTWRESRRIWPAVVGGVVVVAVVVAVFGVLKALADAPQSVAPVPQVQEGRFAPSQALWVIRQLAR